MVLVPGTSQMPCASLPSSFANEVVHVSKYFSILTRSQYSKDFPVSSSMIAFANIYHKPIHLVEDACWHRQILLPFFFWSSKLVCQRFNFFVRNVMRSLLSFLLCALTIWIFLGLWLIFVSSSSSFAGLVVTVDGATIFCCAFWFARCFLGVFLFFCLIAPFWVTQWRLSRPLWIYLVDVLIYHPTALLLPEFCQ